MPEHSNRLAEVDADRAVLDLGRIGLQVDADGRTLALAGAVVEAPVVLRALDDVVHHQTVGEQRLLVRARAIGREVRVVGRPVDGVLAAVVLERG